MALGSAGQLTESPLPYALGCRTRARFVQALQKYGMATDHEPGDRMQVIYIRLLSDILQACEDPDFEDIRSMTKGVRIGVGTTLPRTPAVYARKKKWKRQLKSCKIS